MDFFCILPRLEIPQHPVHVVCNLGGFLSVLVLLVEVDETKGLLFDVNRLLLKHPGTMLCFPADHHQIAAGLLQ